MTKRIKIIPIGSIVNLVDEAAAYYDTASFPCKPRKRGTIVDAYIDPACAGVVSYKIQWPGLKRPEFWARTLVVLADRVKAANKKEKFDDQ